MASFLEMSHCRPQPVVCYYTTGNMTLVNPGETRPNKHAEAYKAPPFPSDPNSRHNMQDWLYTQS